MEYEVDVLPVGQESKSGDAIALRYGNLSGPRNEQVVVVIDGGTKESGKKLVEHIRQYYATEVVDWVVLTHPDSDHASGLTEVLENLQVHQLWMHRPWEHSEEVVRVLEDGRVTDRSVESRFRRNLEAAWELEKLAKRKGIPILEPLSDNSDGSHPITVLGPTEDYYESLLPQFRCMPESTASSSIGQTLTSLLGQALRWLRENWFTETLAEPDEDATSAENNSSVILLLNTGEQLLLFTGDAGVPALERAAERAEELGIDLSKLRFIQPPHHGSKRNVGPSILDRVIGPIQPEGTNGKTAFISAAKQGEPKHPARKVVNAFKRRGVEVYATQGASLCHHSSGAPDRGWRKATPLPFYEEVEED